MLRKYLILAAAWTSISQLSALPSGCQVVDGTVKNCETHLSHSMHIETGKMAVIEWSQFTIDRGEMVRFIQEDADSVVYNFVTDNQMSHLLGNMVSNGTVYLINPDGIVVGPEGVVDVGSFIASTLSSLEGENDITFQGETKSPIVNLGRVQAAGGDVFLLAGVVQNVGEIHAEGGCIGIAAGDEIQLKGEGDERLFIARDSQGDAVSNNGLINALAIELKSNSPFANAVKTQGTIEAVATRNETGRILLLAGAGELEVDGAIAAKEGKVHLLGKEVHLTEKASVDVSGPYRGGEVLVGGDLHGENPAILKSQRTVIDAGAEINADTLAEGAGGHVIVWSEDDTSFHGNISARGGSYAGNGGFIEVSSKEHLSYRGSIDLSADAGICGELLLDPKNVTISPFGTDPATGNTYGSDPSGDVTIRGLDLAAAIDSATVVIEANTDIQVADEVTATTNGNGLTLSAGRSITFTFGGEVTLNNGAFTATINANTPETADRDSGDAQFSLQSGALIDTQGGDVTINHGTFNGVNKGQISLSGGSISAGGGNITFTGDGYDGTSNAYGIFVASSAISTTGTGTIDFTGNGGVGVTNNMGIYLSGSLCSVSSADGDITFIGTGGSDGTDQNNQGIRIEGGAQVSASGSGAMNFTGIGAAGTNTNMGIMLTGSNSGVQVNTGALNFTGSSNGTGNINSGIHIESGSWIDSSSSGTVTLSGTGGVGEIGNCGVFVTGNGSSISSLAGNIDITGFGSTSGTGMCNQGIRVEDRASIFSTGIGGGAATITLEGTAGAADSYNIGVLFTGRDASCTSVDGDISITATGAGTLDSNQGMRIESRAYIKSTGTGANAASITVVATGADGEKYNNGVSISGSETYIESVDGDITVTGTAQGDAGTPGVYEESGAFIDSTGTGTVTVTSNDAT